MIFQQYNEPDCLRKVGEQWVAVPPESEGRQKVFIFHDGNETFSKSWTNPAAGMSPEKKSRGVSVMVSDFYDSKHGRLKIDLEGEDDPELADHPGIFENQGRFIMRPGKERDGYFDGDKFVAQVI